jgi:hypothetical protein
MTASSRQVTRKEAAQRPARSAPARWHPEVVLPERRYMQIFASINQVTTFAAPTDTSRPSVGMRIYDRAECDKTIFWVYRLRHNLINTLWVAAGDYAEQGLNDLALPAAEHESRGPRVCARDGEDGTARERLTVARAQRSLTHVMARLTLVAPTTRVRAAHVAHR